MKFEIIRAGHSANASKATEKGVSATFDGRTFKMREVKILKQSGGRLTVAFKWESMDFVDFLNVKNGKFTSISAQLGNKTLKLKNAEVTTTTMNFIFVEGWSA